MSNIPQLNLRPKDGLSWEDVYDIDAGSLTGATRSNFFVKMYTGEGHDHAEATYVGTDALDTSEFNDFEIGSTILAAALATPTLYVKKTATVWFKNEFAAIT